MLHAGRCTRTEQAHEAPAAQRHGSGRNAGGDAGRDRSGSLGGPSTGVVGPAESRRGDNGLRLGPAPMRRAPFGDDAGWADPSWSGCLGEPFDVRWSLLKCEGSAMRRGQTASGRRRCADVLECAPIARSRECTEMHAQRHQKPSPLRRPRRVDGLPGCGTVAIVNARLPTPAGAIPVI